MTDFTTIEEVRAWVLGDDTDTSQDTVLEQLRKAAEESISIYCDCLFGATEAVVGELMDGRRSDLIVPEHFPINSVEELKIGTLGDGSGGVPLTANDYVVREEEVVLRISKTPQGRGFVSISYTHGYADVPETVKTATLMSVEAMYLRKGRGSIGLVGRSKEGESENYGGGNKGAWDEATGLPSEVVSMLSHYQRIEFTGSQMAGRNY